MAFRPIEFHPGIKSPPEIQHLLLFFRLLRLVRQGFSIPSNRAKTGGRIYFDLDVVAEFLVKANASTSPGLPPNPNGGHQGQSE